MNTDCATLLSKNGLDLDAIHPRNGPQFSPNLYKFLKRKAPEWVNICRVYRDAENILWLGWVAEDGWFTGTRIMGVLCNGSREQVWAHGPGSLGELREVTDFWENYMRVGRCAIDPDHRRTFVGDETRWAVSDDDNRRSCLWCDGYHQERRTLVKKVHREYWVSTT